MATTKTATQASTFTDARAREVMRQVHGDFMSLASAAHMNREDAQNWCDELGYAVHYNVANTFQIKLTRPNGTVAALNYSVRDDGTILEESKAGGFDPYAFPTGTKVSVVLTYKQGAPNLELVRAYLQKRGWGPGGHLVEGSMVRDRAYSKDGFGVERSKVGVW